MSFSFYLFYVATHIRAVGYATYLWMKQPALPWRSDYRKADPAIVDKYKGEREEA